LVPLLNDEEEKEHGLRFIQFLLDAGARVEIPGVPAPQASFAAANGCGPPFCARTGAA
jgi:ferritin